MTTSQLIPQDLLFSHELENSGRNQPPRMTMDEYCVFVWEMLQSIPKRQIDEQKKRDKQIKVAFRYKSEDI